MSDGTDSKHEPITDNGDSRPSPDFDYPEDSYGAEIEALHEAFAEIGDSFFQALGPLVEVMEYLATEQGKIDAMPFHKRMYYQIRFWLRK